MTQSNPFAHTADNFHPSDVRYIKLGKGGIWVEQALTEGIIPFGFHDADHETCLLGDVEQIKANAKKHGRLTQVASSDAREILDFYQAGEDVLWITFANGFMYWAFAKGEVIPVEYDTRYQPSRYRNTLSGWHRTSLNGQELAVSELSSALVSTGSYQRTICKVKRDDYAVRRIRGEMLPEHKAALKAAESMNQVTLDLIKLLDDKDLETLVDLIFSRGGWQRTSVLGETMPDVDLTLVQPVTNETGWVQVKSRANQSVLDDYLGRFDRDGSYDRFFFVCTTQNGALSLTREDPKLHLISGLDLAALANRVGLFDWLLTQTR